MRENVSGELYAAHRQRVLGYLLSKTESREDAEDLCAAVFEKVYRTLPEFDGERASVTTWIFTITRNTLTDYYRTRRTAEPLPEYLETGAEPDANLINEETLTQLADALMTLPEIQRDIIVLRYYEGFTLTKIADLTGRGYGMVKVYHKQALNAIRRKLI